ncbi:TPA: hypothetical protein EYP26_00975 [Candidatus Bathyarchaeota archaeon]|nr:hypothetical protein [Candidatus Bathyarchaeota archaeon]
MRKEFSYALAGFLLALAIVAINHYFFIQPAELGEIKPVPLAASRERSREAPTERPTQNFAPYAYILAFSFIAALTMYLAAKRHIGAA